MSLIKTNGTTAGMAAIGARAKDAAAQAVPMGKRAGTTAVQGARQGVHGAKEWAAPRVQDAVRSAGNGLRPVCRAPSRVAGNGPRPGSKAPRTPSTPRSRPRSRRRCALPPARYGRPGGQPGPVCAGCSTGAGWSASAPWRLRAARRQPSRCGAVTPVPPPPRRRLPNRTAQAPADGSDAETAAAFGGQRTGHGPQEVTADRACPRLIRYRLVTGLHGVLHPGS